MSLAAKVVKGAALKNPRPRKAVLTLVKSYRSFSFAHNELRMNYFGPTLCPCRFAQLTIHAHTKSDPLFLPPLPFFFLLPFLFLPSLSTVLVMNRHRRQFNVYAH